MSKDRPIQPTAPLATPCKARPAPPTAADNAPRLPARSWRNIEDWGSSPRSQQIGGKAAPRQNAPKATSSLQCLTGGGGSGGSVGGGVGNMQVCNVQQAGVIEIAAL
eukprot:jgi/Chlat1/6866/Chrsp51S06570